MSSDRGDEHDRASREYSLRLSAHFDVDPEFTCLMEFAAAR